MGYRISRLAHDVRGSVALLTAGALLIVMLVIGVAIDYGRMQSHETKSQGLLDGATLAAARYMSDSMMSGDSEAKRQKQAKTVATTYIADMLGQYNFGLDVISFKFLDDEISLVGQVSAEPVLLHMFGYKSLDSKVESSSVLASKQAKDVDVVLISDITGSMATTLTAVQDNMKKFTWDLSAKLTANNIKLGKVRVQFIFYRDYIIDNHQDWTGPHMKPIAGLEDIGSMYISQFYAVPGEKNKMDNYVDYFVAAGGGGFAESGLETVWHALNTDWRDSDKTVRSVVLWTDAAARPLHDKVEGSLAPWSDGTVPPATPSWWSDEYFTQTMGASFAAMTKEQREDYMYNNYYPSEMPTDISGIKTKFDEFHDANSNNVDGVKSMAINVINATIDPTVYPIWTEVGTWDGVDLIGSSPTNLSSETYDQILDQVAEMVTSQVVASELAITH